MWADGLESIKDLIIAVTGLLTAVSGIGYAIYRFINPKTGKEAVKAAEDRQAVEVGVPVPGSTFNFQKAWEDDEAEIDRLNDKIARLQARVHRLEIILTQHRIDY